MEGGMERNTEEVLPTLCRAHSAHTPRDPQRTVYVSYGQCTLRTMVAHTRAPWQKGERHGHCSDE